MQVTYVFTGPGGIKATIGLEDSLHWAWRFTIRPPSSDGVNDRPDQTACTNRRYASAPNSLGVMPRSPAYCTSETNRADNPRNNGTAR